MAHDHHLSAHLQVEEHRRDIASKAPSVCASLGSGMVFKFAHSEGSLLQRTQDRKSTRLNSSHSQISYAVFCLKKKKKQNIYEIDHRKECRHHPKIYVEDQSGTDCE